MPETPTTPMGASVLVETTWAAQKPGSNSHGCDLLRHDRRAVHVYADVADKLSFRYTASAPPFVRPSQRRPTRIHRPETPLATDRWATIGSTMALLRGCSKPCTGPTTSLTLFQPGMSESIHWAVISGPWIAECSTKVFNPDWS